MIEVTETAAQAVMVSAASNECGGEKKAQRGRGTKAQRGRGTKAQRGRGTKAQRHRGRLLKNPLSLRERAGVRATLLS
ncbi:MAG: hypothetical protein HY039_08485 [Nitrospirae bacterium]|nr:hypothetical protein [Nitrospirota bacterium]